MPRLCWLLSAACVLDIVLAVTMELGDEEHGETMSMKMELLQMQRPLRKAEDTLRERRSALLQELQAVDADLEDAGVARVRRGPLSLEPPADNGTAKCHDLTEEENDSTCWKEVEWARTTGLKSHPDWYATLTSESPLRDWQQVIASGTGKCQLPCQSCHDLSEDVQEDVESACFKEIDWARSSGLLGHADWYPGMTVRSHLLEWQQFVNKKDGKCPRPCTLCRDITDVDHDDACYKEVDWARTIGIKTHPEWYPGMTSESQLVDWQRILSKNADAKCPQPCTLCHDLDEEDKDSVCEDTHL
jgi:hypothetical protein